MKLPNKLAKYFKGVDDEAEERKEARAVKRGKVSPKQYAQGEKAEGDPASTKKLVGRAQAIKDGRLPIGKYAKKK
jgi:hypothetical protein